jgi:hypothetical protein
MEEIREVVARLGGDLEVARRGKKTWLVFSFYNFHLSYFRFEQGKEGASNPFSNSNITNQTSPLCVWPSPAF